MPPSAVLRTPHHPVCAAHVELSRVRHAHAVQKRWQLPRERVGRSCLYMSHETFTCLNGGCAQVLASCLCAVACCIAAGYP